MLAFTPVLRVWLLDEQLPLIRPVSFITNDYIEIIPQPNQGQLAEISLG